MAVSGVSGGGSSIYGNRNVLSGLASGMDTESMIENMTKATRAKIAQQKQKKTLLGWKQSAYQSVSTPLIEFSKKYMDYQSPTNLLSSAFFDQTVVTSVGKNNAMVSATGKTSSDVTINGVKELATKASHSGISSELTNTVKLETKEIGMDEDITINNLAGESLTFRYGTKRYTIRLSQGADLSDVNNLAEEINKKLGETQLSGDGNLGEKLKVKVEGKKLKFENIDTTGNNLELISASDKMENTLGLDFDANEKGTISISKGKEFTTEDIDETKLTNKEKMSDFLVGKSLTFSVNGETKSIMLLTQDDKAELDKKTTKAEKNQLFKEKLQDKLDKAFGKDKIKVELNPSGQDKGKLNFTTDDNNIMRVTGGSGALFGEHGALGIEIGDGNRLNVDRTLDKLLGNSFPSTGKDKEELVINGIKVGEYGKDDKLYNIIQDINNNSELGISVKYSEISNKFVLETKETGANKEIKIESGGLAEKLFGTAAAKGTDAIVDVTVNGEKKQLTRPSNEIDIDGLKVTVSGKFGDYTTDPNKNITIQTEENVTFDSKPDTEKVFEAIKTMVEEYNKIVDTVYSSLTTKPNRDYKPLTEEQKKEMSKEEIEKWEKKAQEGLLFADSHLRELHNDLRFIFAPGGEAGAFLRSIGIEPSDNYKDGGKIKLDETKLKAALNTDPEKVKNAFNAPAPAGTSGKNENDFQGGVMTRLKTVFDKFASTSLSQPGILLQQAGSPLSANSMLNNALQKQMQNIDKFVDQLEMKLKKQIDRYNSRFTQLEKLVAQMNVQSGQLAGFMGGGM